MAVAILEFVDSVPEPAQRLLRRLVEMLQQVDSARTRMEPAALGMVFAPGEPWRTAAAIPMERKLLLLLLLPPPLLLLRPPLLLRLRRTIGIVSGDTDVVLFGTC